MEVMLKKNIDILEPITKFVKFFSCENPFLTELGEKIDVLDVAFQTYGQLNDEGSNAILICHALTGNSHASGVVSSKELLNSSQNEFLYKYNSMHLNKEGWWDPLIGPNKVFDTNKYFVVCSNILGSCYGTTGPTSINFKSGEKYNTNFPQISIRDMVSVQKKLTDYLGINQIQLITGGSLGGMQVLEWAIMFPEMVKSIAPIACSVYHSPWAIGFNDAARTAIISDSNWENGFYETQPINGLSLARKIAMISYRSFTSFNSKFGRDLNKFDSSKYSIEGYLDYQGEKFINRFDANTYLYITRALDNHNIITNRDSLEEVLNTIKARTLSIGIDSDILYPVEEQKLIAEKTNYGKYAEIKSQHGHDSFLIEFDQLDKIFKQFLYE